SRHLFPAHLCRSRRPDELRYRYCGQFSSGWRLRRQDPQPREAGRAAGYPVGQVRACHQSTNRQSARPRGAVRSAARRRRGDRVKRRKFIALIGGAAAWPLAARAQQPAMPVVGFLRSAPLASVPHFLAAFREGLKEQGFVEGRSIAMEFRSAEDQRDRLPALVADLLARDVSLIACDNFAARAAKAATATVPIVFAG